MGFLKYIKIVRAKKNAYYIGEAGSIFIQATMDWGLFII